MTKLQIMLISPPVLIRTDIASICEDQKTNDVLDESNSKGKEGIRNYAGKIFGNKFNAFTASSS